jgi:hypothetical protein
MAASFAVIALALLVVGTAYAQSALPGSALYGWKLVSENAWRLVSPDPVGTDLAVAARRADELIAVGSDPALRAQALQAYLEVVTRLTSEVNAANEARIREVLDCQVEKLNQSDIILPQLDQNILPESGEPTAIPQMNPTLPIPTIIPETLPVSPTGLPRIVPTIEIPPPIP